MADAINGFKIDGNYWLKHSRSWFSFPVVVHFQDHPDGGFFADENGEQVYSTAQAKRPPEQHQGE